MTAQVGETLIYNNEEYSLATEPLSPYLAKHNIKFPFTMTTCRRGYCGKWLIENNKLYLIDLKANSGKFFFDGRTVGIDYLFPGQNKVFADWYSGKIRIPYGEMMQYVHQGYASLYEKELFLTVESGIIVDESEIDNTHFYNDKKSMEKRNQDDLFEAIFGVKPLRSTRAKNQKKKSWFKKACERLCRLWRIK